MRACPHQKLHLQIKSAYLVWRGPRQCRANHCQKNQNLKRLLLIAGYHSAICCGNHALRPSQHLALNRVTYRNPTPAQSQRKQRDVELKWPFYFGLFTVLCGTTLRTVCNNTSGVMRSGKTPVDIASSLARFRQALTTAALKASFRSFSFSVTEEAKSAFL